MLLSLLCVQLLFASQVEGAITRFRKQRVTADTVLWRPCASEDEVISQGGGVVRFGYGSDWVRGSVAPGALCSISTFGSDPVPGVVKVCQCDESAGSQRQQVTDEMGLPWERCASEGEDCACDSGSIRFGSESRWIVTESGFAKGAHAACSTASFNGLDPAISQSKECWCLASSAPSMRQTADPSVAIVLLSRRAPDLKTWLQYHLNYMGVKHIFMVIEDTPHFDDVWKSLSQASRDRITVWRNDAASQGGDNRPADDYTTLQARQISAMRRAKAASRDMGIDWLIHIDDDELLYAPFHRSIGEILTSVSSDFSQAYLPNVEAVFDSPDVKSCFTETATVNMNRYTFVAYANGKAAVRVSDDDAFPAGPHNWRRSDNTELNSMHLDAETFGSPLMVVHFEACPFAHWEDKYFELGNTSPDKVSAIPFPFYRESITRFMECRSRVDAGDSFESFLQLDGHCSQASLKALWSRWKTRSNPRLRSQDLMPITIPWDKIKASS